MKDYSAENIRNIGVFGHSGEGKTTFTEAMLFNAGLLDRLGKVETGSTTTDFDPEEIKRNISINAALAPLEWKDVKLNIIDAPGFFDFYGEVKAAMRLADSALIVVGAVSGVAVGAEKAMEMCKKASMPVIFNPEPKKQGKSFLARIMLPSSLSLRSPCVRYFSSMTSSSAAASSAARARFLKSTQAVLKRE